MKTRTILLTICSFSLAIVSQAQVEQKKLKPDTVKQMNLLDAQTKMLGDIFEMAGAGADNPLGGATNYREAIAEMDAPEEQKEMLREQYKVYDLSLDPSKKDSLKIMVGKMLENAIDKTQTDIENQ